jgi:MSHA biogenesis protein MshK
LTPSEPATGGAAGGAASGAASGAPVLQSVMLSPTRRAAIISGQLVRLGESYGDAVLAEVAENEVVLNRGGTLQVLKMYPGVDKQEVAPLIEERAPRPRRR